MNREIKFRAWDNNHKTMITPYCELRDGNFWGEDTTNTGISVSDVMQYTGLKDKNGKEIYEGDIVRVFEDHGIFDREDANYEVYWGDEYPAFSLKEYGDYEYNSLQHAALVVSCEVIGNIYENPELLNNEQDDERSVATDDDSSNQS